MYFIQISIFTAAEQFHDDKHTFSTLVNVYVDLAVFTRIAGTS